MKLLLIISACLFTASLFGATHHPSVSFNINSNPFSYSHLRINHQSTYISSDDDIIILSALYKPHLNNAHSFEMGIGMRQFSETFGGGVNFFYSTNNNLNFFSHQFSPGFEFFAGPLQFSFNQYHPKFSKIKYKKNRYKFDTISEIGITYKPSPKVEFEVIPFYNHASEQWGCNGRVSGYLSNLIELEIAPFYRRKEKRITFSIGFNFGGPKQKYNQSIRKNHMHVCKKIERNSNRINSKHIVPPVPISPISNTIIQHPQNEVEMQDIPLDVIRPVSKITVPSQKWSDYFIVKLGTPLRPEYYKYIGIAISSLMTYPIYRYYYPIPAPLPPSPYDDIKIEWISFN